MALCLFLATIENFCQLFYFLFIETFSNLLKFMATLNGSHFITSINMSAAMKVETSLDSFLSTKVKVEN